MPLNAEVNSLLTNNKVYFLTADNSVDAMRLLRKLMKRRITVRQAIFIVEVDDHRKVQKLPGNLSNSMILILGLIRSS